MTWVKICGITNLEDALAAVDAGADALGFVFYPPSPRNVRPELVGEIVGHLPKKIEKVGVFVGNSISPSLVHKAKLTAIQIHSTNPTSRRMLRDWTSLKKRLFIVLSSERIWHGRFGGHMWRTEAKQAVDAIFLDSGTRDKPGGTGVTFDWANAASVLRTLEKDFKFVVAGGLNCANVANAIAALHPWGVDVSSGVEAKPGKKDPQEVRAFVQAVRASARN